MKTPNSLSDEELKDYAETHLQYEIEMLTWSVGILAFLAKRESKGLIPWAISNGILNTFSMHARNLIDFLYSRSRGRDYPTDIIINDFVEENDISSHLVPITPLLEEALIKANKQVAHLSMKRIDYEKSGKEWKFIEVMGHIRYTFSSIAPYISDQKISKNLKDRLSLKQVRVPVIDVTTTISPQSRENGICLSLRDESQ